ncbi:MAG: Crp/Fnr family transcriptional regulator [Lachnospiraceae bacterium]|nr:Crp/Fnr family transcriptional regulator [Lachnospiraceae bacterium]
MSEKEIIKELSLLNDISPELSETLVNAGKIIEFPKGKILMRQREPVDAIYFQLSGKSMIYNLTHHGKRKILFIYGKGTLLNENIFNNYNASVYCETLEKSRMLVITVSDMNKLMEENYALVKAIIEAQEKKIWRLGHQLKNTNSSIFLEKKLAAKLWKLARDFGKDTEEGREIDLNLSVTFLADMLGVSRETTSRMFSILAGLGLVKQNKKRIIILDEKRLSDYYRR